MSLDERNKREWDLRFGGRRFLPRKLDDGTYTPGIGHTGSPWPQGRGHDYCWDPYNCISCGCTTEGPCYAHRNLAYIEGWRP